MAKPYEIRDPVHGFISLNEWEWDIINTPVFQRLRRIKQLAWTDMVYPAAMHTRFEHSLGVMHVATRLFETLRRKDGELLRSEFLYTQEGLGRQKQLIRLAALLHDIGHGPFSHAAEELFPLNSRSQKKYEHEDYSSAAIEHCMKDVLETHSFNKNNFNISVDEIKDVFSPKRISPDVLVWKNLTDI